MPVDKQKQKRLRIIDNCLRSEFTDYTKQLLLKKVNMELEYSGYRQISIRTLDNDIAEIEASGGILCEDLREGHKRIFRYKNTNCTVDFLRMDDADREKIRNAIYILKDYAGDPQYDWIRIMLMQVDSEEILDSQTREVVSFQHNPELYGIEYFSPLLEAILKKQSLKITYKPYDSAVNIVECFPYYLKQYNGRWFLIAKTIGYPTLSIYSLDRIKCITTSSIKYEESEVDLFDYFYDTIGVSVMKSKPEEVLLKVNKQRYQYIQTKPLHGSQRKLETTNDYVIIQLKVQLNKELEALILSYGDDVEVLQPLSLRTRISDEISSLYKKYCNFEKNLQT